MSNKNGLYRPSRVQLEDGTHTEIPDEQLDFGELIAEQRQNGSRSTHEVPKIGFELDLPQFLGSVAIDQAIPSDNNPT